MPRVFNLDFSWDDMLWLAELIQFLHSCIIFAFSGTNDPSRQCGTYQMLAIILFEYTREFICSEKKHIPNFPPCITNCFLSIFFWKMPKIFEQHIPLLREEYVSRNIEFSRRWKCTVCESFRLLDKHLWQKYMKPRIFSWLILFGGFYGVLAIVGVTSELKITIGFKFELKFLILTSSEGSKVFEIKKNSKLASAVQLLSNTALEGWR